MFPRLITLLNPIPEVRLQSRSATIIAPLWEINAIFPFGGIICANEEFNGVWESVIPKLFGPIIFMPYSLLSATNSSSNFAPSSPISLKPALITTMFSTPASPQSFIDSFTKAAGMDMITKSTFSGTSLIFSYAFNPWISPLFGLIGYTFPLYPPEMILSMII